MTRGSISGGQRPRPRLRIHTRRRHLPQTSRKEQQQQLQSQQQSTPNPNPTRGRDPDHPDTTNLRVRVRRGASLLWCRATPTRAPGKATPTHPSAHPRARAPWRCMVLPPPSSHHRSRHGASHQRHGTIPGPQCHRTSVTARPETRKVGRGLIMLAAGVARIPRCALSLVRSLRGLLDLIERSNGNRRHERTKMNENVGGCRCVVSLNSTLAN